MSLPRLVLLPVIALVLFVADSAGAGTLTIDAERTCKLEVGVSVAHPGSVVDVRASGMQPGNLASVEVADRLVSGRAGPLGDVALLVEVPVSRPTGPLEIRLVAVPSGCSATASIEITPASGASRWLVLGLTLVGLGVVVAAGTSLRHMLRRRWRGSAVPDLVVVAPSSGQAGSPRSYTGLHQSAGSGAVSSKLPPATPGSVADVPAVPAVAAGPGLTVAAPEGGSPIIIGKPVAVFEPRPAVWTPGDTAYRAEMVADGFGTNWYSLRAASIRGYDHRWYGSPRQDDLAIHVLDQRRLAIAVSDGVSAASHSHVGAAVVTRFAANWLAANWESGASADTLSWDQMVSHAAWSLAEQAGALLGTAPDPQWAAEHLAATLTCVAVEFSEDGSAEVWGTAVGDSGLWILKGGSRYESVIGAKPIDAPIFSTAVIPLPWVPSSVGVAHTVARPGDVLLVGTDGFGDPLGDGNGLVGDHFRSHLATPPAVADFVRVLDFSRELFGDDRTLVAIWPSLQPGELPAASASTDLGVDPGNLPS